MPTSTYYVELATAAGANPTTWTDITAYCQSVRIARGRDDILTDIQPGTCSLTLINTDGRFSPAYTSSPLYPNVQLMRAIRISAAPGFIARMSFATLATYTFAQLATMRMDGGLYYGYITDITPRPEAAGINTVAVQCVDGFTWLDIATATPVYTSSTMASNVASALTAASWPTARSQVATGVLTFTPSYGDTSVLSQLQGIVNTNEGGLLYMNGSGDVVAQDQSTRFAAPYLTSAYTFADTSAVQSLDAVRPISDVANAVKVTYAGSSSVTKTDTPSTTAYGPRRLNLTASFLNGTDADDWASWLLSQRKDPHERLGLSFVATSSSELLIQAAVRDISDRITWSETTGKTGTGGEYYIERIEHQIDSGGYNHVVRYQLSPVVPYSRQSIRVWWTLGTSTLGTGTRLAY